MGQHAKFAPSAAHRWITCPGSIRMSENIESVKSEYASEGTALHEITASCLIDKKNPEEFIGIAMTDIDNPDWSAEFEDEHADAIQYCIDEVKRFAKELGTKGGRIELKVEINEDCWGTVDVLLWNSEWVVPIDFKFGRGKSVEAEGNPQLMLYYLGAMKYLHDTVGTVPRKAKLVIIQPRLPNPTREWDTTFKEIKTWYQKSVKPAYEKAKNGDAPCNPGDEQCQFCPANGVCTSRAEYLLKIAEHEMKPFAVGDENYPEKAELVRVPETHVDDVREQIRTAMEGDFLTPSAAGKILQYQPDFDNFFKKVGEYALKTALDGTPIPGYKIVYGKSNRKWKGTEQETIDGLTDLISLDDMYNQKLISPAQAEKKLGRKKKGEIQDLIVKPLGKKILVDESDTREEVDLTGEADMAKFATAEVVEETPVETGTSTNLEDPIVFEEETAEDIDDIMSGLDVVVDEEVHEEILHGNSASPPSKKTKKYQLMVMGLKGGVPIKEAADEWFNGDVGQVKKGLRNLNERDGYTVIFHPDETFTVKE